MSVQAFARNPARYAKANRIPATIILFGALVAIAYARAGRVPDQRSMIALGAAAAFLVLVASFAPDLVFYLLLAAILVAMVQNADVITSTFEDAVARVQAAIPVAA